MAKYIMALDQGTSSSRCIMFDHHARVVSMAQKEFTQYYPHPGWVEHDAMDIWSTQMGVAQEAMSRINAHYDDIAAIGITNQRETIIVWDRYTGEPIGPAIVWQCRRSADICQKLKTRGLEEEFRLRTGLPIDAYFSATKLNWILEHIPEARRRAEAGDLLFGTVDTWLLSRLTQGRVHATDYSNASRTMLFNLNNLDWDDMILRELDIPRSLLPRVQDSSGWFAETDSAYFGGPIPITGVAGDQQAALFGQNCFRPGQTKNTYGTGCFLLMNTGLQPVFSRQGLITTIAWGIDGEVEYALEGSVFIAGAAMQWLRDEMRLLDSVEDSAYIAQKVNDTNGVYMVPAFVGLGAPHWQPYALGTLVGISRGTNKNHLVRATLEATAYQSFDVIRAMEEDSGLKLQKLKVDGGVAANDFLMQFQADITQAEVERPANLEVTALGAAYLAGLATGFWHSREEIAANWQLDRHFYPQMEAFTREEKLQGWRRAIKTALAWAEG